MWKNVVQQIKKYRYLYKKYSIDLVNSEEELLKVVARLEKLEKDTIEGKKDCNNRIEQEKTYQLRSTKLHGQFRRDTDDKKSEKSWHWLRNGNLKREIESLWSAAQEQTLNINSEKFIMRMSQINVGYVEHMWRMFCT